MKIEIKDLSKSYEGKQIFKNFSLTLESKKVNSIIGASGGGKSTLLNIIAGLLEKDSGSVFGVNEEEISYIFQEDRLLEWLTVRENIEIFIYNYYSREEAEKVIDKIFNMLNIKDTLNEYPAKLSGGMKQRVNIARALIKPSKVILMDEPFKSLDYKTKYLIIKELKSIFQKEDRMVIFVTHDVDEAIFMEGNIYVLGGRPFEIKGVFKEQLEENKEKIIKLI